MKKARRPHRRLQAATLALALTAVTAPAAHAVLPIDDPPTPATPTVSNPTGFDWSDAAIGFAAGAGTLLVASGSVLAVRSRRPRVPVR